MAGFTLAEVMLVTAILAVAAGVALPSAAPLAEVRLDAAASEVAAALRFAREDAMRTHTDRMVTCDTDANRIAVYELQVFSGYKFRSSAPVTNPITQQPYLIELSAVPAGGNIGVDRCAFTFADGTTSAMTFDPDGNPVRGTGDTTAQTQALTSGTIVVKAGAISRAVTVELTGRVTAS